MLNPIPYQQFLICNALQHMSQSTPSRCIRLLSRCKRPFVGVCASHSWHLGIHKSRLIIIPHPLSPNGNAQSGSHSQNKGPNWITNLSKIRGLAQLLVECNPSFIHIWTYHRESVESVRKVVMCFYIIMIIVGNTHITYNIKIV